MTLICFITTKITTHFAVSVKDKHLFVSSKFESELSTKYKETGEWVLSTVSLDVNEISLEAKAIGDGAYGVVYKGSWRGQDVAGAC